MNKEEIIQLHLFLLHLRNLIEPLHQNPNSYQSYEEHGIYPQHVNKSKKLHKQAVFELSKGIAESLSNEKSLFFQQTHKQQQLCDKI
jgi:hypothetical protein